MVVLGGYLFEKHENEEAQKAYFQLEGSGALKKYTDEEKKEYVGSLYINKCSIIPSVSTVDISGKIYFGFAILHLKSKKSHLFLCEEKETAEQWIAKLITIYKQIHLQFPSLPPLLQSIQHPTETLTAISGDLLFTIEQLEFKLFDFLHPNSPNWDLLSNKNGIVSYIQRGEHKITVKSHHKFPYSMKAVWSLFVNSNKQTELDKTCESYERLQFLSPHTWVDYAKYKAHWPVSSRDFVTFNHWRLLNDGSVALLSFSEPTSEALKPAVTGTIRGECVVGGLWFIPAADGTQVYFLVQMDLKGHVPYPLTDVIAKAQPEILLNAQTLLATEPAEEKDLSVAIVSYEELRDAVK